MRTLSAPIVRAMSVLGVCVGFGVVLTGCESTEAMRQAKQAQDESTCSSFGARYGSPAYTDCMLTQQQRRDAKRLQSAEETRLLAEAARVSNETAIRVRCERDARRDRDEGRRPRRCD